MQLLTCSSYRLSLLLTEMSTNDDRPASSGGRGSPAPRSKLSSLLGRLQPSKAHLQHAVSDFHLKLHKPHHQHSPGDLVTGSIVLSTTRAMRITHITLTLSGIVMLFPSGRSMNYSNVIADVRKQKGNQSRLRGTPVFASGGAKGVVLFEEETVIVGEGRLGAGGLEVGFETEFPAKGLVSSLDFERGQISYQLTATLTRPTTLNPVMQCTTEVKFRERVDVAYFHPPKPLTLSIEAVASSRHRLKSSASSADRSNPSNPNSPQLSPTLPQHSQSLSQPIIPAAAASTSASASNHTATGQTGPAPPPSTVSTPTTTTQNNNRNSKSKSNSNSNSSTASVHLAPEINPTATIELQKAGCLPGDVIPLKISILHTKPIKSLSGIIVTLSRQGRFDTFVIDNPTDANGDLAAAPLTAKSLTFSRSAISTFRKDLDQSVSPLIVDPKTLTSVVRTSVRLPEDAFPSVTNVPGGVVSFTYFVEVIVDLGGKLAQKGNAIAGAVAGGMNGSGADDVKRLEMSDLNLRRGGDNTYTLPGGSVRGANGGGLDTHKLRREKGVISCTFEVVVGTCNSNPGRVGISRTNTGASVNTRGDNDAASSSNGRNSGGAHSTASSSRRVEEYVRSVSIPMPTTPPPGLTTAVSHTPEYQYPLHAPPTPPEPADEKARIRLAEMQLLPSAPPPSRLAGGTQPSAPILLDGMHFDDDAGEGPSGPAAPQYRYSQPPPPMSPQEASEIDKQELERRRLLTAASAPPMASSSSGSMQPSAPAMEDFGDYVPDYASGSSSSRHHHHYEYEQSHDQQAADDKQELERRRLMGMASAPPVVRAPPAEPSAPTLDDDGANVALPRYER